MARLNKSGERSSDIQDRRREGDPAGLPFSRTVARIARQAADNQRQLEREWASQQRSEYQKPRRSR